MYPPILLQRDPVIGVVPPPSGISPNFSNPPSRAHTIIAVHIILPIISTLFILLRFYTALFITRHVKVDDYLVIVAWFCAILFSISDSIRIRYGLGRHLWDITLSVFNPNFNKFGTICFIFYGISIALTKLSILTLFIRFVPAGNLRVSRLRVTIYVIMAIVVIYNLVASFNWLFSCRPMKKFWDITVTSGSCIHWIKFTVFSGVMNSATDIAILVLPALILRTVQLPKRQKIGVTLVLMTGGFVLVVSIIRLRLAFDMVSSKDITWDQVPSVIWWAIEVHIAIVCACLPAGKPFLRKYMPKLIGSSYNASIGVGTRRGTIRSIHTQQLPSRDVDEDPQDIILESGLHTSSLASVSTSIVEHGTERFVRTEDGSDKGLIIMASQKGEC